MIRADQLAISNIKDVALDVRYAERVRALRTQFDCILATLITVMPGTVPPTYNSKPLLLGWFPKNGTEWEGWCVHSGGKPN